MVPFPVSDSTSFESDALLMNVSEPEVVPLFLGVNATLNAALCPALMVNGKDAPFSTN
jgi:hypothetical protein